MSESILAATDTPNAASVDSVSATPKAETNADAKADAVIPAGGVQAESGSKEANKPNEVNKEIVYSLKLPEGSQLEAAHADKIVSLAKERGLSNEQAQAILEHESEAVSSFALSRMEQHNKQVDAWVSEVKNDKELGGEMFKENMEHAKRVVDKFGSDSFKQALNSTGFGNHPELVRVFAKIGKLMSEDKLVLAGSSSGGSKSMEDIFYSKKEN